MSLLAIASGGWLGSPLAQASDGYLGAITATITFGELLGIVVVFAAVSGNVRID